MCILGLACSLIRTGVYLLTIVVFDSAWWSPWLQIARDRPTLFDSFIFLGLGAQPFRLIVMTVLLMEQQNTLSFPIAGTYLIVYFMCYIYTVLAQLYVLAISPEQQYV